MPRRTTCLYCEADGVTTLLVPGGGTWSCPIHSREFLERSGVPAGWALIRKVTPEAPKARPPQDYY